MALVANERELTCYKRKRSMCCPFCSRHTRGLEIRWMQGHLRTGNKGRKKLAVHNNCKLLSRHLEPDTNEHPTETLYPHQTTVDTVLRVDLERCPERATCWGLCEREKAGMSRSTNHYRGAAAYNATQIVNAQCKSAIGRRCRREEPGRWSAPRQLLRTIHRSMQKRLRRPETHDFKMQKIALVRAEWLQRRHPPYLRLSPEPGASVPRAENTTTHLGQPWTPRKSLTPRCSILCIRLGYYRQTATGQFQTTRNDKESSLVSA
ncbi:hypothetical protein FA13DRAFT_1148238 [Coprinellus micaceus]|uniref:Uncharacterized protein n=1 Tax=Coprinellus micaceus TaxID=71717 RepID=A0A4Y7RI93_COPMI|nr:hypothetical protein FA13DRAFT_1148238 [Coprinellus micaceus]